MSQEGLLASGVTILIHLVVILVLRERRSQKSNKQLLEFGSLQQL